ncbi:hypothetical protein MXB_198 [Myxobolus squamalis]|nr:hypothetical protein MXB_198 [Myxobolus squamalis]
MATKPEAQSPADLLDTTSQIVATVRYSKLSSRYPMVLSKFWIKASSLYDKDIIAAGNESYLVRPIGTFPLKSKLNSLAFTINNRAISPIYIPDTIFSKI